LAGSLEGEIGMRAMRRRGMKRTSEAGRERGKWWKGESGYDGRKA
jgi:hypothetical protein